MDIRRISIMLLRIWNCIDEYLICRILISTSFLLIFFLHHWYQMGNCMVFFSFLIYLPAVIDVRVVAGIRFHSMLTSLGLPTLEIKIQPWNCRKTLKIIAITFGPRKMTCVSGTCKPLFQCACSPSWIFPRTSIKEDRNIWLWVATTDSTKFSECVELLLLT